MQEFTSENFNGIFRVRCIKSGGVVMTGYGGQIWTEGQEMDLLHPNTPIGIRMADLELAFRHIQDQKWELARRIAAGEFEVVEVVAPTIL